MLFVSGFVRQFDDRVHTDNLLLYLAPPAPTKVDLSKATRLKDLTFRVGSSHPEWVTTALQTITTGHRDLQKISISLVHHSTTVLSSVDAREYIEEQHNWHWLELDRLLGRLWVSHSIPPKILCYALSQKEEAVRTLVGGLFPETTVRGTSNLVGGL